jgi:hypothetical protein
MSTKINNFIKVALAVIMLFNTANAQTKNNNVLDLFDGVVKVDASTGNITPNRICDSTYFQSPASPTASNINLSTPLNTTLLFDDTMFQNTYTSTASPREVYGMNCIQSRPNFGNLFVQNGSLFDVNNQSVFNPSLFTNSVKSYVPPTGFKGVACYDIYLRLKNGVNSNRIDTNVVQVKIQVGGTLSTNCGPDTVLGQLGAPFPSFWVNPALSFPRQVIGFIPPGSSTTISGVITNGFFTPSLNQIIPFDSFATYSDQGMLVRDGFIQIADGNNNLSVITNFTLPLIPPLTGQVGSPFPNVYIGPFYAPFDSYLSTINFPSTRIAGKTIGGIFIPNPGQIIPLDAELMRSEVSYQFDRESGTEILTNFTAAPNGGVITINTTQPSSSQSTNSSTTSSSVSIPTPTPAKPVELSFNKGARKSGVLNQRTIKDKDGLDITDPYICEQQVVTGNVKYTGDKNNLNPVSLKIKGINGNTNSYTSNPTINEAGDYESDVKNIKSGNYEVEYSISDKLGNTASGSYTFEKKEVCNQTASTNGKGSSLEQSMTNNQFNLARTGGEQSSFVFALMFLTLFMFITSEFGSKEIKE